MPSNVEIKAKVSDYKHFLSLLENLSGKTGEVILQEDIFFHSPQNRLKLRILKNSPSQLISYSRPDQVGPKLSKFFISEISKPNDLKIVLSTSLGIKGVIKKERLLFHAGQTRIHLDKVENLGCFVELEVILREDQTCEEAGKIVEDLMQKLNVKESDLIKCAYIDLLEQISEDL